MRRPHVFRDENGVLFTADAKEILAQLALWLERSHGGFGEAPAIVTSHPSGGLIATLEIRPRPPDHEPATDPAPVSEDSEAG